MSVAIGTPQPFELGPDRVGCGVDQRRDQHATDRRGHRERRPTRAAQFAGGELPLDLEAGDEEVHGHHQVADPAGRRVGEPKAEPVVGEVGVPERVVAARPRRVRPQHRHQGGGHQHPAGGRLDARELLGLVAGAIGGGAGGVAVHSSSLPTTSATREMSDPGRRLCPSPRSTRHHWVRRPGRSPWSSRSATRSPAGSTRTSTDPSSSTSSGDLRGPPARRPPRPTSPTRSPGSFLPLVCGPTSARRSTTSGRADRSCSRHRRRRGSHSPTRSRSPRRRRNRSGRARRCSSSPPRRSRRTSCAR